MEEEHYALFAIPGNTTHVTQWVLRHAARYTAPGFVLVPYVNPGRHPIQPQFFGVLEKRLSPLKSGAIQPLPPIRPGIGREEYIRNVREIKRHIARGNIYEINYCIEFSADNARIDPLPVFAAHIRNTEAPFAMMLKNGNAYVICGSPELFLKKEGRNLLSKPMKGTARRGGDAREDALLKKSLHESLKERTEHVMAVDVARNDLSIVAEKGSVVTRDLFGVESFRTVHQMVSQVRCSIRDGVGFDELMQATFPMASMTGAPKTRAMELIDHFENFPRGAYSGAMGRIDENGDFELAVIIRSIFYDVAKARVSFAVGGAITYQSDPESEYAECMLKAKAMLASLNMEVQEI